MSILLLEVINGFKVAIKIVPNVIPRVARVVYIFVRPNVGQKHLASVSSHVGESVKNMSMRYVSVMDSGNGFKPYVKSCTGISDGGNLRA